MGYKCAYLGTLGFFLDKKQDDLPNTSPDTCTLYELFMDAYNKGAIPLNTLCNAVLRKFDDMDLKIVENYERVAAQEMEDQQQQVKLR